MAKEIKSDQVTRRKFSKSVGAAAGALAGFHFFPALADKKLEKPTLAGIGAGGKGTADINGAAKAGFEVVALVDVIDVNEVQPMPTAIGSHEYVVHHAPVVPFRKPIYYVWAVDENGDRHFIGWPSRTSFTQADCQPAPAARGMVTEQAGNPYLEVCPDECWWELSWFDSIFPPGDLPPLGTTVDIFGEIQAGMEGPYINATSWEYAASECLVVPNEDHSWGSLKANYR